MHNISNAEFNRRMNENKATPTTYDGSIVRTKVAVIGAGIAGLGCCHRLRVEHGLSREEVLLLEARDRIGGRVHTCYLPKTGIPVDAGASWIHGVEGSPLVHYLEHVPSSVHPHPQITSTTGVPPRQRTRKTKETSEGLHRPKDIIIFDGATKSFVPPKKTNDMQQLFLDLFEKVENEAQKRKEEAEAEAQQQNKERSNDSLGIALREAFEEERKKDLGMEEHELETRLYDFFLHIASEYCGGPMDDHSLSAWIEDEDAFPGTHLFLSEYSIITDELFHQAQPTLRLNQQVVHIDYHHNSCSKTKPLVRVKTKQGLEVECERAVVTLPLGILRNGSVRFQPDLPESKREAIQGIGWGLCNKVFLCFERPFWGDLPEVIGYIPDNESHFKKTTFLNLQKIMEQPILMLYLFAEEAHEMEDLTDQLILDHALSLLSEMFPHSSALMKELLKDHFITRWGQDECATGAYTWLPLGASAKQCSELARSVPFFFSPSHAKAEAEEDEEAKEEALFFAGEATNEEYYSYAHGALLSGYDAADRVVASFKQQQQ